SRNCTEATPTLSDASAVTEVAPARSAPSPGAVSETVGAMLSGAATWLSAELADVEPPSFVAVTTTRMVEPTSAVRRTYVPAEPTGEHGAPEASQRCHA